MSTPDVQPLSDEYHKAHKQVTLCAALLLCWEFVGVDLNQAKSAGGTIGAVVGSLKSPQAVPWVLVVTVLYFLFKFNVEWHQCNDIRRRMRAALFDFWSAWIIACTALLLFGLQTASRVQFADSLNARRVLALITALVLSLMTIKALNYHHAQRYAPTLIHYVVAVMAALATLPNITYAFSGIGVIVALILATALLVFMHKALRMVVRMVPLIVATIKNRVIRPTKRRKAV